MNLKNLLFLSLIGTLLIPLRAENDKTNSRPIFLKTMGSLFFGGTVVTLPNGETFHGDHGYAQYFFPTKARNYSLILWHGMRQSGRSFESRPDGGKGFMLRLPRLNPDKPEIDEAVAQKMVERAMEAGVNYFDTAYPHHDGQSEIFVGKALKKYQRNSYFIATKMWSQLLKTEADIDRMFQHQLQKLQTDYIDFYPIHALDKRLWAKAKSLKVYEYLLNQKKAVRIRHLGFSFHDEPEVLAEIVREQSWDFAQIQLNYVDWELYRSREQYEIITKAGIPVVIMEPLSGSSLATLTPRCLGIFKKTNPGIRAASWTLRYADSMPNVPVTLSGMTLPEHLEDNIRTFTDFQPLSGAKRETIAEVIKAYHNTGVVPCTNCKYCMPCPVGVEIPRIFGLYNCYKTSGDYRSRFGRIYAKFAPDAMASACVNCGACAKKCPQHINIQEELKKIHTEYEERSRKIAFFWNDVTEHLA